MDDPGQRLHQEREAYAALSRLRDTLDALPEDHPAIPIVQQAVDVAAGHWRSLRGDAGGAAPGPAAPADRP